MEFTREVKEKWLDALRSGRYVRGTGRLIILDGDTGQTKHCCLGVLADMLGMGYKSSGARVSDMLPYNYRPFVDMLGEAVTNELWKINDSLHEENSSGYEMVIPIVESIRCSDD